MLKRLFLFFILIMMGTVVYAEPVTLTPVKRISTSKKDFKLGNVYSFRDIRTGEIYTSEVTYYRPNGMTGQEVQVEFANFKDSQGNDVPGKINAVAKNHKIFQEYANGFVSSCFFFIRGSELILKPNKHTFILDNTSADISGNNIVIHIKPSQEISTTKDDLDVGDNLVFQVTENVYKNKELYIPSGQKVYGVIDYIDENGWGCDSAVINIKKFRTTDISGKPIFFEYDLKIDGFEILNYKSKRFAQFFNYISSVFRGKEVDIKDYDNDVIFTVIKSK